MTPAARHEKTGRTARMAKTFVLVHGAWHGGWCWRRVADLLEAKGPQGLRADADRARRALASAGARRRPLHPHHRHRQRVQVGAACRRGAVRAFLRRLVIAGVAEQMRAGDRLDRVPRRLRARTTANAVIDSHQRGGARGVARRAAERRARHCRRGRRKPSASTSATAPGWTALCTPQPVGDLHREDRGHRRAASASPGRPTSARRAM